MTKPEPSIGALRRATAAVLAACAVLAAGHAQAQSEASAALSMLPVASVVGTASVAGAAASSVVAIPIALAVGGAVLTVKAVEASARGTLLVLERASDGVVDEVLVAPGQSVDAHQVLVTFASGGNDE